MFEFYSKKTLSSTTEINDRSTSKDSHMYIYIYILFVNGSQCFLLHGFRPYFNAFGLGVQPGFHANAGSCCSGDGGVSFHSGAYPERQSGHRVHPRHTIFKTWGLPTLTRRSGKVWAISVVHSWVSALYFGYFLLYLMALSIIPHSGDSGASRCLFWLTWLTFL